MNRSRLSIVLLAFSMLAIGPLGCGGGEITTEERNTESPDGEGGEEGDGAQGDLDGEGDGGSGDDGSGDGAGDDEGDGEGTDGECSTGEVIPEPALGPEDPCRPEEGWARDAIFVAAHGDDGNEGALASPIASIQTGIDRAVEGGKSFVLVQAGTYEESFVLAEGIQLIGAYDVGWNYQRSSRAIVRGGNPTIRGEDIVARTRVVNFRIDPVSTVGYGESVVTAYLSNADGVALHNVQINGGRAGDGQAGTDGLDGFGGAAELRGGDGEDAYNRSVCITGSEDPTEGGFGRVNQQCTGGNGGRGGDGPRGGDAGNDGSPGEGGAAGGAAAPEGGTGGDGSPGAEGAPGEQGRGGTRAGSFDENLQWIGEGGGDGLDGQVGGGGGGGGSGGGEVRGALQCDRWGGAGGGGGAGGCGGTAGTGGTFGGASVALFLVESDVEIRESRIVGGTGGDGGRGGIAGRGGEGGRGGAGGNPKEGAGGGGKGGDGGDGGAGGNGGGGSGGPSFAIFSDQPLSTDLEGSRVEEGSSGKGGGPAGETTQGEDGEKAAIQIGL